jgi:murein DD-endopeptidase MepM/ murein hydrolase activator NlpD
MIIRSSVTFAARLLLFAVALESLADDYDSLSKRHLILPIEGLTARDIQDTFGQGRAGGKLHEASDLLAPRGTPIMAVEDGVIQKLFLSKPGGLTIYEFDSQGVYCYYYAHLDRYAEGLSEGMHVKQREVIGYVGTSGNAPPNTPHLHFAIFKLGLEKHWWQGVAINPYPLLMKLAKSARDQSPSH